MRRSPIVACLAIAAASFCSTPHATAGERHATAVTSCDVLVARDGGWDDLYKIGADGTTSRAKLGDFPFDVTTSSDGRFAYVSGFTNGVLHVVDLTTMAKVATVPIGVGTNGLEISPDDRTVYAAAVGGVYVVDTATLRVVRTIATTSTPYDMVITPDGTVLYASNPFANVIDRIDLETSTSSAVQVPAGAWLMAITPDGSHVFAAHEQSDLLTRIDTNTLKTTSIEVGDNPRGIDVSPDGKSVYFVEQGDKTLSVVDVATMTRRSVPAGEGAYDVTVDATGARAYVNNYFEDEVSVIDTGTLREIGTLPLGSASQSWNIDTVCPSSPPFTRPGPVNDLFVFANFFCGPCTTAWLLFTRPANTADFSVFVDSRPANCTQKGYFFDLALCQLTSLTPGAPTRFSVVPTNGEASGSTASTVFALRP